MMYTYRILHELLFDIYLYETSLGNVIKRAFDEFYNFSVASLTPVYSQITTSIR